METIDEKIQKIKFIEAYIDSQAAELKAKLTKTILLDNATGNDLRGDMSYKLWRKGAWFEEYKV